MDNVKEALEILQGIVAFERDKEIQDEIKKAIDRLQKELYKREREYDCHPIYATINYDI